MYCIFPSSFFLNLLSCFLLLDPLNIWERLKKTESKHRQREVPQVSKQPTVIHPQSSRAADKPHIKHSIKQLVHISTLLKSALFKHFVSSMITRDGMACYHDCYYYFIKLQTKLAGPDRMSCPKLVSSLCPFRTALDYKGYCAEEAVVSLSRTESVKPG